MNDKEPYRATKLWNEVITAFKAGMPLKKHRYRIHSYNDCFTGSEAVTWLHCYLMNNPNFGPNVTRLQTVNLLQKFLKCYVIESTILKSKKKEFLDDSHLYKFTSVLLHHPKPSVLCLVQSPSMQNMKNKKGKTFPFQKENIPECHLVERKLSAGEIKSIWEKVTLSRLDTLIPHIPILDILDNKFIDGHLVKYNICRLSKTGVVCLLDKTDDIPHWVISAMKCLANWPNASGSGSCLPNYPGFEKDVFKVVRDFFRNPQVSLLPECFTSLLLKVFNHYTENHYSSDKVSIRSEDIGGYTKNSRLTCTDIKTSTPLANDVSFQRSSHSLQETSEGKLLLDDPEVMWEYPSVVYFETDFGTAQPVTRVVSDQNTSLNRTKSQISSLSGSVNSVSTISICSSKQESLRTGDRDIYAKTPLKAWNSNMYLQDQVKDEPQWLKTTSGFSRLSISDCATLKKSDLFLQHYSEPSVYKCEVLDLNESVLSSKTITESTDNIPFSEDSCHFFHAISNSSSHSEHLSNSQYKSNFIKDNIYCEDLKLSFQLILLFLPSANRRQLHLLLRLINKIIKNGKFTIDASISLREFLLKTFLPAIVQSDDASISCLYQMTAFLVDYCEQVFCPPTGLKEEVIEICRHYSGRIKFTVDDTCFITYCEMISKQQYEQQKVHASVQALKDLLNSIVHDNNISEKERKKKLKQFKTSHPDIYMMQFPTKASSIPRQKSSFFNKLVNLRM